MKYLALLLGINVGGKNPVRMGALRAVLPQLPLDNVRTYIQSGNVLFESKVADSLRLSSAIEHVLTQEFGFAAVVVVVTEQQLECVVANAPAGFGSEPEDYRYDVAFVKPPLAARDVLATIALKPGVDRAYEANDVIYLERLTKRVSQSHLPKLVNHPAYGSLTLRNWRTTTELRRLARSASP